MNIQKTLNLEEEDKIEPKTDKDGYYITDENLFFQPYSIKNEKNVITESSTMNLVVEQNLVVAGPPGVPSKSLVDLNELAKLYSQGRTLIHVKDETSLKLQTLVDNPVSKDTKIFIASLIKRLGVEDNSPAYSLILIEMAIIAKEKKVAISQLRYAIFGEVIGVVSRK